MLALVMVLPPFYLIIVIYVLLSELAEKNQPPFLPCVVRGGFIMPKLIIRIK